MRLSAPTKESTMFIALALSGVVLYIFGDWLDKRQRAAREREFKRRYDE